MTGKSKYSDNIQKRAVELIRANKKHLIKFQFETPSDKTLKRWQDKWTPIIYEEIRQDNIRHEQTRKRQHKPQKKEVRQDVSFYFSVPYTFLSDYKELCHTWLSAYKRSTNGASIRRRERIQNELERIKKEVDK